MFENTVRTGHLRTENARISCTLNIRGSKRLSNGGRMHTAHIKTENERLSLILGVRRTVNAKRALHSSQRRRILELYLRAARVGFQTPPRPPKEAQVDYKLTGSNDMASAKIRACGMTNKFNHANPAHPTSRRRTFRCWRRLPANVLIFTVLNFNNMEREEGPRKVFLRTKCKPPNIWSKVDVATTGPPLRQPQASFATMLNGYTAGLENRVAVYSHVPRKLYVGGAIVYVLDYGFKSYSP
ncbi:uncharacterized protein LACBIDRAFT_332069 [Laccaria bicolor S238N-H82]|uniref:Predicted protein n=1 Tax=Laccaria bicolor (strain S238N-H82 / ATCC MYA-4686) TaxID=486041 RepID=B0DRH0_LACBS|nr:uncharacterized protein LACBIDRAFT_332069 [Laccaria bicolor S238N-H82]EDR02870.1 predicted protein [Laccaria bicolor S238N-H82]|eukprot:XP_001886580.1 predicted protein [Laccaria bicolor S238N-H82]